MSCRPVLRAGVSERPDENEDKDWRKARLSGNSAKNTSKKEQIAAEKVMRRQPPSPMRHSNLKEEEEMPVTKTSRSRSYGRSASKSVKSAMHRKKKGTLKSGKGGKGGKVTSRKQAIAIGLSEARKKGAKVPKKKSS
jgi:hypothetical protein